MFQPVFAGGIVDPTDSLLAVAIFFAVGAILTLVGLYLNYRRETSNRRKSEQEFDEDLVKRAVSAGRLAAEKITDDKTPKKRRKKRRRKKSKPTGGS
jgi:hypothetical protein